MCHDYSDAVFICFVSPAVCTLALTYITCTCTCVHSFTEGLAVGVGFGAIGNSPSATLESAR